MRLWHTKLIKALTNKHLVAQWREISAIAKGVKNNGTPNHVLVNFVTDYDYDHLISYAYYVREELTNRGIRTMNYVWDNICSLKEDYNLLPLEEVYKKKMNGMYLRICFYNLYEKYLCGMISDEEIAPIYEIIATENRDMVRLAQW